MKREFYRSLSMCTALAVAGCTSKTIGGTDGGTTGGSTDGDTSDTAGEDDGSSGGTTEGTTDSGVDDTSGDGATGPECTEPGEVAWSWEDPSMARATLSPVVDGRLSVIATGGNEDTRLIILDAGNGSVLEDFELTGDDEPEWPLLADPTLVFLQRDEEGRTYILHAEAGDEEFTTMV
jgi:hypothetical protein